MHAWIPNYTVWLLFPTVLLTAFLLSSVLVKAVKQLALNHHLYDVPNERSSHVAPMPRLGGVGIVLSFFIVFGLCSLVRVVFPEFGWLIRTPSLSLLAGGAMLAATGLWDDLRGMRALTKLFWQVVAALVAVIGGARFPLTFLPLETLGLLGDVISVVVTVGWIVLMINAVNLIDGLDGLAAGVSVIGIFSITVAFALKGYGPDFVFVGVLMGSIFGFLRHNRHPARIFMGDCGSLFLGFMVATFALPATGKPFMGLAFLVPVMALGLPLLDTGLAVVRRAAQHKGIFSADRDHIHHRVTARMGLSHRNTVLSLYAVSLCFGALSILVSVYGNSPLLALILSAFGIVIFLMLIRLGYIQPLGMGTRGHHRQA